MLDKKGIFMVILYVVLLIMMYIFSGILILNGEAQNKSLYYSFFGFSILISILCVMSLIKSDSKSKMIRYGMGISTILMFTLLIISVILSKPKSDKTLEIVGYVNIGLVLLANLYATAMVISPAQQQQFEALVA